MPDDRVLQRDPVGAEDGRRAADLQRLADVVELAEADLLGAQRAGVLAAAEVQREEQALDVLEAMSASFCLGQLEPGDRPPNCSRSIE